MTKVKSGNMNSETYWDKRFAEDWESNSGEAQSVFFINLAQELLPDWFKDHFRKEQLSLCDWGCAEGDGTNVLAKGYPKNKITGIDFADTAIEKAKLKFPKTKFEAIDLLTEKHKQRYDVVFTSNVLEHFDKPWKTFEKISNFANDFVVVMVPFEEDPSARIPEHFASFTLDNIPVSIGEWSLVHLSVTNTEHLEKTYWAGKQAVMIFTKNATLERLNLKVVDLNIYTVGYVEKEASIQELQKEIDEKNDHIRRLEEELQENWLLLTSKRYNAVNKVVNKVSILAPRGSFRRKIIKMPIAGARRASKIPGVVRQQKFKRDLVRLAKSHKAVVVHSGMPWNAIMRQRPHHLAEQLASLGYMMVYIDPDTDTSYKISDSLIIVKGYECLDLLSPLRDKVDLYYLSSAGFPSSFEKIKAINHRGFKLIYEYIDELDETISGNLSKQIEVFNRLDELNPVLLLASAKKLYAQLAERFPKSRLLLNENGVDNKQFAPKKRAAKNAPADIRTIIAKGRPIVGYYGALAPWLDYDLINKMTSSRSDYEFVFIGIDYNHGLQHLEQKANVHYLGPKNYNELAEYSYWFDCALIPFKTGEIAKSTSPLKLFEYMAMGLPTVCTRDLRECSGYKGVLMSKNTKEYIDNVDKAIRLKKSQKARNVLMDYARQNTWKVRAKDIVTALEKLKTVKE